MDENTTQPIPAAGDEPTPAGRAGTTDAQPTAPQPSAFATPDGSTPRPVPPAPHADAGPAPHAPYASAPQGAAPQGPASQPPYGSQPASAPQGASYPQQGAPMGAPYAHASGPYATPAAHAPYGQHPQGASFGPGAVPSPSVPRAPRKARTWPAVVATAAATALVVGGGTAFVTTQLVDNPAQSAAASSSVHGLGKGSTISVDSIAPASWEEVAARVAPSVVAIDVVSQEGEAQGSGVIIDTAGHIVTNNHVVAGATNGTVTVTLSDGRLLDAKIVGVDASTDLAIVKLVTPPSDLTAATLANSDDVVVGNAVMAVGNPLGLANTVTTGIVSAVDRPVSTSDGTQASTAVTNAIQIDAAINPGNSGGPLFNAQGEVIGITSSIATLSSGSGQSGSIGLGFAIPSNLARSVGDQLIAKGEAQHAFLGVSLRDGTATADGTTRRGAQIVDVTAGSAAAKGGVLKGDVVVAIDGKAVSGAEYLTAAVRERVEGDRAVLTVVRDGAAKDLTVTLTAKTDAATTPGDGGNTPGQGRPSAPNNGSEDSFPGGMTQDEFFQWLQENL